MIHELKIDSKYFIDVKIGGKSFEVRKNDRNYKINDYLALNEIKDGKYTGESALFRVTYILDDADYCKDGYVVMAIKRVFITEDGNGRRVD